MLFLLGMMFCNLLLHLHLHQILQHILLLHLQR
jgi:hypothetical protein